MIDHASLDKMVKRVRLLVLDVDGVMTDGSIWLSGGDEFKRFHVKDGAAIKYLQRAGIAVAIITGRQSEAVSRRAGELNIHECLQGCLKKLPHYLELLARLGLKEEETACMGDDLPDLPLFNHCCLKIATSDAAVEVRERADIVTAMPGGNGAIREAAEILLKGQGKWQTLVEGYLGE